MRRQAEIDIVDDGELGKGHWLSYLDDRLGGFEKRPVAAGATPLLMQGEDHRAFPAFYEEAAERGTLFYSSGYQRASPSSGPTRAVCARPITYIGQRLMERDVHNLRIAASAAASTRSSRGRSSGLW